MTDGAIRGLVRSGHVWYRQTLARQSAYELVQLSSMHAPACRGAAGRGLQEAVQRVVVIPDVRIDHQSRHGGSDDGSDPNTLQDALAFFIATLDKVAFGNARP
jgi:hypothetical protein